MGGLRKFIPLGLAVTLLCGLMYFVEQQNLRMNANDPQIQFAQDIANSLAQGTPADTIIPPSRIDMGKSLAVFIMIFDANKKLTISTGEIGGKVPELPVGVFDTVSQKQEVRFTWQPQAGVRSAAVVEKYKNGYVLVGRSLKEVEIRENKLLWQVFFGWAATMVVVFIAKLFVLRTSKKRA
ncbi:MAG: hypothetical protein ACM3IJ_04805 [Candidatus Levyibacteriota bacterium]